MRVVQLDKFKGFRFFFESANIQTSRSFPNGRCIFHLTIFLRIDGKLSWNQPSWTVTLEWSVTRSGNDAENDGTVQNCCSDCTYALLTIALSKYPTILTV